MTNLVEEVIADIRSLPEDEQDRVAEAVLAFMHDLHDEAIWRMI